LGTASTARRVKVERGEWIERRRRQPEARDRRRKESQMFVRFALCIGTAIVSLLAVALAVSQPSWAENPPPAAATATKPDTPAQAAPAQPTDAFGEDTTLVAKPIVYVKGTGKWDDAFQTIAGAFKRLKTYADKEGLKVDGLPMTVFTSTDDIGFQYQAAVPISETPKSPPRGDIAIGQSPEGHALKFIHRGSYDDLDNTYEAITNYLDEKRLEAKDVFIEEYVTDPVPGNENKLIVNVFVLLK
jgi:effector-binding domain-containing protein